MNDQEKEKQPIAVEPTPGISQFTAEERAWILAEIKEARRTQHAYARRMRAFGRHTEDTMKRRFTV